MSISRAHHRLARPALVAAAALLGSLPGVARAEDPEISWSTRLQTDIRFRVEPLEVGDWYNRMEVPAGVARNQNLAGTTLSVEMGKVSAVADVDLVVYGISRDMDSIGDLALREESDPFRFDVHQLYVGVRDLIVDGLDLKVGQQLAQWGAGDQFNPTNLQNPDNVEDPLRFGDQLGNVMARLDYWISPEWSITGVLIPIFRPALLPRTANLGTARVDRVPLEDEFLRWRIEAEQFATGGTTIGAPTIVKNVTPSLPDTSFENMQVAYRIGGSIAEQEVSLSYYKGRNDFPVPRANHAYLDPTPRCNPDDSSQCIDSAIATDVTLEYPEMHAFGLNLAGEIPWLQEISDVFSAIGYRIEGALIVPEKTTLRIDKDALDIAFPQPAGEYDYDDDGRPGGREPTVIDDTPFLKWVVGLDYTFEEHTYLNVMWVHGMVDEYGAGDFIHDGVTVIESSVTSDDTDTILRCALPRDGTTCVREVTRPKLGDYLVAVFDVKFLNGDALARIFAMLYLNGVWESYYDPAQGQRVEVHHGTFSEQGFSMTIFPEFNYNFQNGLELGVGGLALLGNRNSKFGDPQTGGSLVWTRARYSF